MSGMFEKLSLFLDKIKNATFWDRVWPSRWRYIKSLSYEAYSEYKKLVESLAQKDGELGEVRTTAAALQRENEQLKLSSAKLEMEINTKKNEIERLQEKIENFSKDVSNLRGEIGALKESDANRAKEYENRMATIDSVQRRIENEREQEKNERHRADIERIASLRENWSIHQEGVKEIIKGICQKHVIEYVEKVPFKGNPDNTIKICDEYVVFDAKSPGTEDLANFYKYIRTQTENVKKYAKEENVKKEIFLVVPSNTIDVIEQQIFNMGDYNVYVVTVDVLEPLIISLRKIEDYEFAKELKPEERESICRIIGKFRHTAKRRIQIDNYFARQFLDILTKCEIDIPSDLLQKAIDFEKAEKINPPVEKRAKQLPSRELIKETGKIQREAEAKDIVFPDSIQDTIKKLPLYDEDQKGEQNQRE